MLSMDSETVLLIIIIAVLAVLMFIGFYYNILIPFKRTKEYILGEMARSKADEYEFWKKELRKLYLRYVPVVGLFVRRYIK